MLHEKLYKVFMNTKLKKILVTSALCFTLYNTLPSVFFYSKPINAFPTKKDSVHILEEWNDVLTQNDENIKSWLGSYAKGLNINLLKISALDHSSKTLALDFAHSKDVSTFEKYFAKACSNLPFKNTHIFIAAKDDTTLYLVKNTFLNKNIDKHSTFIKAYENKKLTDEYKQFISSRINHIKEITMSFDPIDLYLGHQKNLIKNNLSKREQINDIISVLKAFKNQPGFLQKMIAFAKSRNSLWSKEVLNFPSEQIDSQETLFATMKHSLQKASDNPSQIILHPLIKSFSLDETNLSINIQLHDEVLALKDSQVVKNMLVSMFSKISDVSGENFVEKDGFYSALSLKNSRSPLIITKLNDVTHDLSSDTFCTLKSLFRPQSQDFSQENFTIVEAQNFSKLSIIDQESALIVGSGYSAQNLMPFDGSKDSLFIVYKNGDKLLKDLEKGQDLAKASQKDFKQLLSLITSLQFKLVPQADLFSAFKGDLVFELKNPTQPLWNVISENHKIYPSLGIAVCELSSIKDRLHLQNLKELKQQEALLKWSDHYQASLNNINGFEKYTVAKPFNNPLLSNIALNLKHFFKGSEKKALKFGLDLSGGKNILIQLEDQKGKKVTQEEDIKTAINELYARVNRLGVSEVSIRQEGDYISLDFPGSQNLSAKDLVNASSMYFHIVNEEFSYQNSELYPFVNEFLSLVWHQAEQSGNTDTKNIQKIAFKLLNDQSFSNLAITKLKEKGLKLANPDVNFSSYDLNTNLSKIVKIKLEDKESATNAPLLIVFNNYALEGAALKDINTAYDASKGNFLSFNIQKNLINKQNHLSPQDTLFKWTSKYTKNKMQETFKPARGWRMAVVLNSEVVSSPVLESALKDAASINGSFSQQDLLKLKADLQAGSMTFQPKIVYEQNIAPELGESDKASGFASMAISLALVTILMAGYYRFHGLIATSALILNLFMLFAFACFLNITLSLASIAGIVLTLGMAVDANVLIFERMREEKAKGSNLKDSVLKGYTRAFTAIVDSNLTTMIAALVLLGFDSGPIKGFALTLLIGLITSVITALFMTKMFYLNWIEKTKVSSINFSNLFKFENLNFFKHTNKIILATCVIFFAGAFSFITNFNQIIGMDFKGGYAFNLKINHNGSHQETKNALKSAFIKSGLKETHIHVRELEDSNHLRVFLDKNMNSLKKESESWQNCLSKVTKNTDLVIDKDCLRTIDTNILTISGQLSDSMTKQAILGLFIALCAIFVYVLIRFEWAYAISATISLCHDVILTIASIGILSYFNVPINLDMSSLAAILTIIGYSLNDTIIVFDRIREDVTEVKHLGFKNLVLRSLNTTLSRTIMTSATTLIVLIPMIFMGHGTLFNFSLVMTIGVVMGTLSTLFIACPLLILFRKEKKTQEITV
jgi:SecD/SecF fusion protein